VGDLGYSLPGYFGLSGRAVKERGYYVCNTGQGPVKIHKTSGEPREINARYELQKRLSAAGFSQTDFLMETPQGAPYLQLGRDVFIMTRHISGRELDLDNLNDVALALESLAKFHLAARDILTWGITAPSLTDAFSKQTSGLTQTMKQVGRRPRLSDFDVLLLKHAPAFAKAAEEASAALAETDYTALYTAALDGGHICHNALKEENLPIFQEACYILNLSEASRDLQLADLASFIRRYARRSNKELPIGRLLEIYNKFAPLPASAAAILFAQLSYPWPFMKLVSLYYSKKRNFTPVAIKSRMDEILTEQEIYDEYISNLV